MSSYRNLSTDLLRTFVTVHDLGGVTRAGEILGRSQPAISLQIKRLEAVLDEQLFSRETHKFELTTAGELLLEYARNILELNDELFDKFSTREITGSVKLGLPSEFATTLMPRIIGKFTRQYPDVTLEVGSELSVDLRKKFKQHAYDLVLALHQNVNRDAEGFIKQEKLVWVANRKKPDFENTVPLIVAPAGCIYRKRALSALKAAKVKNKIVYTIPDLHGIESAIGEGLGVTVLATSTVPDSLVKVGNSPLLPELGEIGISLLMQYKTASAATHRLASYLQANLQ